MNDEVVFTAVEMLAHRRKRGTGPTFAPPKAVIFCYQPGLLRYAVKRWRGKKTGGFLGDFYLLKKTGGQIGVIGNFGVGAPVTAVLLEDFVAFGVQQFCSIGMAGGLQETLDAGDLVIADRAVRDEGTSRHYLPPASLAAPSTALTRQWRQTLAANGTPYAVGATWTTDAPYRETTVKVVQHQQDGVLTVEMETAAFFAVAQFLGVEAAAGLAIGDVVGNGRWQLDFDNKRTEKGLQILLNSAIQTIMTTANKETNG